MSNFIQFVIKIDGNTPVENPIAIETYKELFKKETNISKESIEENGYAPFNKSEMPRPSNREKVQSNGYTLDADGWAYEDFQLVAKSDEEVDLNLVKEDKKNDIRTSYNDGLNKNVTVSDIDYDGGWESASKLYFAIDLAERMSETEVKLYDANNVEQALSIADATTVANAVAQDFKSKLEIKQRLFSEIDAASNLADIDAITAPSTWDL